MKAFARVTVASLAFSLPNMARAEADPETKALKSMLAMVKAELSDIKARTQAIGSLQQAFLSEADFQKQMGKNWVLCDGRSVVGSTYEALGYGAAVPNCTGRFLRSAGGNAAPLRTAQEQAIDVSKISASTTLTAALGVSVNGTTDGASWAGDLAHSINEDNPTTGLDYNGVEAWKNSRVGRDGPYWDRMFQHVHSFSGSGSASGGSWSTTLSNNGEKETRPSNITVNTFIKIN